jgi:hypothetical protein
MYKRSTQAESVTDCHNLSENAPDFLLGRSGAQTKPEPE